VTARRARTPVSGAATNQAGIPDVQHAEKELRRATGQGSKSIRDQRGQGVDLLPTGYGFVSTHGQHGMGSTRKRSSKDDRFTIAPDVRLRLTAGSVRLSVLWPVRLSL